MLFAFLAHVLGGSDMDTVSNSDIPSCTARTKTNSHKQSKNEINTKNQSRKLNENPTIVVNGGSGSSSGKYVAVKA